MSQLTERKGDEESLARRCREIANAPSAHPMWAVKEVLLAAARAIEGNESLWHDDDEHGACGVEGCEDCV